MDQLGWAIHTCFTMMAHLCCSSWASRLASRFCNMYCLFLRREFKSVSSLTLLRAGKEQGRLKAGLAVGISGGREGAGLFIYGCTTGEFSAWGIVVVDDDVDDDDDDDDDVDNDDDVVVVVVVDDDDDDAVDELGSIFVSRWKKKGVWGELSGECFFSGETCRRGTIKGRGDSGSKIVLAALFLKVGLREGKNSNGLTGGM